MPPQSLNSAPKLTLNHLTENPAASLTESPTEGQTFIDLSTLSKSDIQNWLATQIADQLGIDSEDVENNIPFHTYGLDSVQAMAIATAGKQRFGLEISPLVIWNCPTIDSLSDYIAQELNSTETDTFEI